MPSSSNKATNQSLPFWVISSDGNLLPNPVQQQNVRLSVAERVDIIVDFTGMSGKIFYIENRLEQTDGRGPTGNTLTTNPNNYLVKLEVVGTATDNSLPVNAATTFYTLPPKNLTPRVTREFKFERKNGQWAINNKFFDHTCGPNVVRFRMKKGFPEHFIFKNSSGGWQHPIHLHVEEFQTLTDNGNNVTGNGNSESSNRFGRKDVWRLRHNNEVKVQYQVRDWTGLYPMHCHNTVHEDHEMMLMYEVNNTGDNITKP
jgi:FtsP/CotA-like multicopper oxidase with cupredoxin domain